MYQKLNIIISIAKNNVLSLRFNIDKFFLLLYLSHVLRVIFAMQALIKITQTNPSYV